VTQVTVTKTLTMYGEVTTGEAVTGSNGISNFLVVPAVVNVSISVWESDFDQSFGVVEVEEREETVITISEGRWLKVKPMSVILEHSSLQVKLIEASVERSELSIAEELTILSVTMLWVCARVRTAHPMRHNAKSASFGNQVIDTIRLVVRGRNLGKFGEL